HEAMVAAGALDSDQAVAEFVDGKCLPNLGDGGVEVGAVVGEGGRRDEDAPIEVGEEELGAGLGTVEADDAEVGRADLLDAGMEHAARLAGSGRRTTGGRAVAGTRSSHGTCLRKKGWGSSHSCSWQSGRCFFQ